MRVSTVFKYARNTAAVWCMFAAIAWAQQPNQGSERAQVKPGQTDPTRSEAGQPGGARNGQRLRQRESQSTSDATEVQGNKLNYAIASCLLDHNQAEVDLAKIAVDHAKNDEVKQFAQQMVEDHSEMVAKLQKFIGSNQPNDRRSQIDHKINERCAESMRKELEGKSGQEFDACYIGSQIAGHMHAMAALEVLTDETSGDLHGIVKDAKPVVEKHLKHAKDLMENSNVRQASKDRSNERS